jgi:hypothetical protein
MIREQILELASQSPEFGQGIDIIEERLSRTAMVPEDLDEAIEMLEAALENPAMYAEMVQAAIADGLIDEGDAPAEFDAVFIISILMALYGLQERGMAQGYARGGLTVAGRRLANQGQGGDSMLAHINPREAEVLRRMGGQGTVNPNTGLAEYKSLKKTLKTVLPVALMVFAPGLGTAIGTSLGLTGTAAAVVGSSIVGAGTAAATGGDWKRGAIMGGITGGIGNVAGDAINQGLNLGLSAPMAATLGSGLVGGAAGVVSGDGFKQGALQGAGGQLLKNFAGTGSGTGAPNAFQGAIQSGVDATGNMLTAGYTPRESLQGGATAGLFSAGKSLLSGPKPSEAVVDGIKQTGQAGAPLAPGQVPEGTTFDDIMAAKQNEFISLNSNDPFAAGLDPSANFAAGNIGADLQQPYLDMQNRPMPSTPGMFDSARDWIGDNKMAAGMLGLGAMGMMEPDTPVDVVDAVSTMSPEQQEYFNRPLTSWDWDAVRQDANRANLSLTEFMAQNFNNLTSGQYNMQSTGTSSDFSGYYRGGPMRMNQGGALEKASRYVRGGGTGRSDEIPAYLSDGEYVVDAETVSMLGDGSSKAGAEALNGMREGIRSHKGKVLAKGKFSPNAKSPLNYLRQGIA